MGDNTGFLFQELCDEVLKREEETYHNPLVPWAQHKKQLIAQFRKESDRYQERFENGIKVFRKHILFLDSTIDKDEPPSDDPEVIIKNAGLEIYRLAIKRYEKKAYTQSADLLFFLIHLNPHNPNYWILMGMSEQMNESFESAIKTYYQALLIGTHLPHPYLYLAQCFYQLQDYSSARIYLDALKALNNVDDLEVLESAAALKTLLPEE